MTNKQPARLSISKVARQIFQESCKETNFPPSGITSVSSSFHIHK